MLSEVSSSWTTDLQATTTLCDHVIIHDSSVVDLQALETREHSIALTSDPSTPRCTIEIKFTQQLRLKFICVMSTAKNVEIHGCVINSLDSGGDIQYIGTTRSRGWFSRDGRQYSLASEKLDAPPYDYLLVKFIGAPPSRPLFVDSVHLSTEAVPQPIAAPSEENVPLWLSTQQGVNQTSSTTTHRKMDATIQEQMHVFASMARAILSPDGPPTSTANIQALFQPPPASVPSTQKSEKTEASSTLLLDSTAEVTTATTMSSPATPQSPTSPSPPSAKHQVHIKDRKIVLQPPTTPPHNKPLDVSSPINTNLLHRLQHVMTSSTTTTTSSPALIAPPPLAHSQSHPTTDSHKSSIKPPTHISAPNSTPNMHHLLSPDLLNSVVDMVYSQMHASVQAQVERSNSDLEARINVKLQALTNKVDNLQRTVDKLSRDHLA